MPLRYSFELASVSCICKWCAFGFTQFHINTSAYLFALKNEQCLHRATLPSCSHAGARISNSNEVCVVGSTSLYIMSNALMTPFI